MKKLLLLIIIVLFALLTFTTIIKGIELGPIEILGIQSIKEKNEELDTAVTQATKLASTDFPSAEQSVKNNVKKLQTEKQKYEDMVTVSTESQVEEASMMEGYSNSFLWVQIGTYARREGVVMKMDFVKGESSTENTYNLDFTVTGPYIGITDFISDIEDDSKLGFRIEQFKMTAGSSENELQATFVCKDIKVEGISGVTENTDATNGENGDSNNSNTNNSNATNNSTNSNNTNTSNTNSSNTNNTNSANTNSTNNTSSNTNSN